MSTAAHTPAHSNGHARFLTPPAAGAGPAGAAPDAGITSDDVLRLLRWNAWLIVTLGLLGLAAGFALHHLLARHAPRYRAEGLLRVQRSQLVNPITDRTADLADAQLQAELRTHAKLLTSEGLFSDVLKRGGAVRQTAWFGQFVRGAAADAAEVKEEMARAFSASPLNDSMLLAVAFTAGDPGDAKTVLEAIVNEHLRRHRDEAENARTAQTRALRDLSRTLSARITELSARTRDRQGALLKEGVNTTGVFGTREIELRALTEARLAAASEAAAAQQDDRHVQEQLARGEPVNEVEKVVQSDPAVASLSRDLVSLEIQQELARGTLGARHPDVVKLDRVVELTRATLDKRRTELRRSYGQSYSQGLRLTASRLADAHKDMHARLDEMTRRLAELSRELPQLALDQQEERELRALRQQVDDKLRDIDIAQNLADPLRIQWASEPQRPDRRSFPRLASILPASTLAGLALAGALVLLREMLDQRVRSPLDVRRVGQLELLAMVAHRGDDPHASDAALAIHDAPDSLTADQFRQLRVRLPMESLRSIMVTSPGPADGKTTVAANLAAALAETGREVLLVDANFRRPALSGLFQVPRYARLADVVSGRCALADAVRATRLPNLSVLPAGSAADPAGGANHASGPQVTAFILQATQRFDHVIFDAPPLLVASGAASLAAHVDGVLTVVRARHQSRGRLRRLRDALRQVKARHLGVVLNAVRSHRGGYFREAIRTFYGYGAAESRPPAVADNARR